MAAQVSIISIDTEPTQIYPQISAMVLLWLYHTAEHLLVLTLGCWSIHFICKNHPHLALEANSLTGFTERQTQATILLLLTKFDFNHFFV